MHHPALVVTRTQAPLRGRTLFCLGGVSPQVNLCVNNKDIGTLETALNTRVFTCLVSGKYVEPPRPSPQLVRQRLGYFGDFLCQFQSTPVPHNEVVESYSGRKKLVYQAAYNSLQHKRVNKSDAISKAFVKAEKVAPDKAPRCIQPRDPRYNLELGRYIRHIEHRIYRRIQKLYGDGPTVMKGYNVDELGNIIAAKWHSFNKPVAIGLDATKFDMHVSPELLGWEHSIYNRIFKKHHLKMLLHWQMFNEGRGYCDDGKLKYKVHGKRFSGDMNTSLGNCIIMCGLVHAYAKHKRMHVKLANNGDDCVVFMEAGMEEHFQCGLVEWFLEMGFRMVAEEPVYELPKVEFCQMHPIRVDGGYRMVRNIPHSMSKDAMCLLPLNSPRAMREWLGAIGGCGLALCGGVPVMQSYYINMIRNGSANTKFGETLFANSGMHRLSVRMESRETQISPESRYDVWLAWGILPDHQVALEKEHHNMDLTFSNDIAESSNHVCGRML